MNIANNKLPEKSLPQFSSTVNNSKAWRLWHSINFLLGGVLFVLGSACYYPFIASEINGYVVGGWLFTIGSANFLIADFTEWRHFRRGCLIKDPNVSTTNETCFAKFKRAELGLNFFLSFFCSFLYLVGSVCFIPDFDLLLQGELLFIIGSVLIVITQFWKCFRTAKSNPYDDNDTRFRWVNIYDDFAGFNVDLWAAFGGLTYAVGTYLFAIGVTDKELTIASHVFVLGGSCFTISACFLQYRYFCTKPKTGNLIETEEA
jgi:hypothetical protein